MNKKGILKYAGFCFTLLLLVVPHVSAGWEEMQIIKSNMDISTTRRHEWNPWPAYNSVDDEFFVTWRMSGILRDNCDPGDDYECTSSFQSIHGARISPNGEILGEVVISPPEGPAEDISWKMWPRLDHNEFRNEYLMTFYMCEDVCAQCHVRDPEGEPATVDVSVCLECHPGDNPQGPACNLVTFHADKESPDGTIQSDCTASDCHTDCDGGPPPKPPTTHPSSCMECHVLEEEDGDNPIHYRAGHTAYGNKLYTVRIDNLGNTLTPPKKLYDPPVSSAHGAMVFNPERRQYFLGTTDRFFTNHYDNLGFIVDEDANIIKGPIFFGEGSDGSWSTFLYYVAYNPIDDTYLFPYEDFRHAPGAWYAGPNDIYGTLLDGEGNILSEIPIMEDFYEGEHEQWYPSVAHNPDRNEFLCAWFDERPIVEDGGIVGRIINADGTLKPDNILVDTTGSQGDVAIVYASKHKMYFIVYQSTQDFVRPPDKPDHYFENDIYARWVDENGLPVGDEIPIYLGEGDQTTPQVSYSPASDRFLIVWWDTHAPDDFDPVPGETGQYGELASVVGGNLGRGSVYGTIYGTPPPAFLTIGDQWANCGDVGVKIPICLVNLEVEVGAVQVDLCENIDDCLVCVGCEMTERTTIFDCMVNELENGCCALVVFSKNPGGVINPGECDIVIIDYTIKDEPQCCNSCIDIDGENLEVVDQYGYIVDSMLGDNSGMICPFECGDVEPAASTATIWDCGDGNIDIFDILEEVDFIIHVKTPDDCQAVRADVPTGTPPNCDPPDGTIDVGDLMVIIDMALNRQDCCSYYYGGVIY